MNAGDSRVSAECGFLFDTSRAPAICYFGSFNDIVLPRTVEVVRTSCFLGTPLSSVSLERNSQLKPVESPAFAETRICSVCVPSEVSFLAADAISADYPLSLPQPRLHSEWVVDLSESDSVKVINQKIHIRVHLLMKGATSCQIAAKCFPKLSPADKKFPARSRRTDPARSPLHRSVLRLHPSGSAEWSPNREPLHTRRFTEGYPRVAAIIMDGRAPLIIVVGIAAAIVFTHESGIIYRDLKPGNMLLGENRRARIWDFGSSRNGSLTRTITEKVGTPLYKEPDLYDDAGCATGRATSTPLH
jgi:hypothetical protein